MNLNKTFTIKLDNNNLVTADVVINFSYMNNLYCIYSINNSNKVDLYCAKNINGNLIKIENEDEKKLTTVIVNKIIDTIRER